MHRLSAVAPVLALIDGRGLLMTLLIGGIAGWLAGQITRRQGFGVLRNILIGILGSVLGGIVFGLVGLAAYGLLGQILMATLGALLLLYIINAVVRPK
jgi:uncharacterized membrane protein YeaQ/YmgE (transglycosylase-associated protein family)